MDFRASLSFLKIAPRKVRLVADQIKGLSVPNALSQLNFSAKSSALPLRKLLDSAVAGAQAQEKKADNLFVKSIYVNEGPKLKRYQPRAFGRASVILKRSSHIILILTDKKVTKSTKPAIKEAEAKIKDQADKKAFQSAKTGKSATNKTFTPAKPTKPAQATKK